MDLSSISPFSGFIGSFFEAEWHPLLILIASVILHSGIFLISSAAVIAYADRKLGADIQMRIGPNRVGPAGVFQIFSDFLKSFFKQENVPQMSESWLFRWGPLLAIVCVFVAFGPMPFAHAWAMSELEWGAVFVVAMLAVVQLMLFLASYSSGSSWSTIAAFRLIVMLVSFLVPVLLAICPVLFIAGSANISEIVVAQGGFPWKWTVLSFPTTIISFGVMFVGLFIWQGRAPFDFAYAGRELSGGVAVEYSGIRKGFLTFLQYLQLLLSSAFLVAVFLGGWNFPISVESLGRAGNIVEYLVFSLKVAMLIFLNIWVRWSLPRLRADQIVYLSWKVLVPAGLIGAATTAIWMVLFSGRGLGDFL